MGTAKHMWRKISPPWATYLHDGYLKRVYVTVTETRCYTWTNPNPVCFELSGGCFSRKVLPPHTLKGEEEVEKIKELEENGQQTK